MPQKPRAIQEVRAAHHAPEPLWPPQVDEVAQTADRRQEVGADQAGRMVEEVAVDPRATRHTDQKMADDQVQPSAFGPLPLRSVFAREVDYEALVFQLSTAR